MSFFKNHYTFFKIIGQLEQMLYYKYFRMALSIIIII
jgi:hypothetical protein